MHGHWLYPTLAGVPAFFIYAVAGAALLAVFGAIYSRLTAHDEFELIRSGNVAAALAFGGSFIGFSIPLSRAVSQAGSIPDLVIWALLALSVQVAAYLVARWLVKDISAKIAQGDLAAGLTLAAFSLASGMLNAASMTL